MDAGAWATTSRTCLADPQNESVPVMVSKISVTTRDEIRRRAKKPIKAAKSGTSLRRMKTSPVRIPSPPIRQEPPRRRDRHTERVSGRYLTPTRHLDLNTSRLFCPQPATPQCPRLPAGCYENNDTNDTHFSDLTCPQGYLRVPFGTLQAKTFLDVSHAETISWKF
jgi:hypothetical protein